MPQIDLEGKTVMIATTGKWLTRHMTGALEDMGATVIFSDRLPQSPSSIAVIGDEVEKHEPKIDALIIHNSNIALEKSQTVALELTKRLKKTRPVIVCDFCDDAVAIQTLKHAGAKYVNFLDKETNQIAFEVADAIAQHGKPGRKAAV